MILPYKGILPKIAPSAWIAESAQVIGDTTIGKDSSIWFGAVVRGDVHRIRIGQRTNIQDLSVCHVTRNRFSLTIGSNVTVGHRVILHGCTLGNRILVGMGSIIMDGAVIGDDTIIGAGSLVTEGTIIPSGHLALGSPAKVKRTLTDEEKEWIRQSARHYISYSQNYKNSPSPISAE
ncbi:MAG: gamma carbonic anhydrase family protein [Leptospirillum sp.]|jgi:carbonic anhydrase/acetyltransferase-like protein (isoleucine patch superfamily)